MSEKSRRSILAGAATLAAGGLVSESAAADFRLSVSEFAGVPGWSAYRGNASHSAYVPTDSFPEPETVAWEFNNTGDVVAAEGRVFVRTDRGLHVLDADDGSIEWSRQRHNWKGEDFTPVGYPSVNDGIVYISGNQLTALNVSDGSLVWADELDGASEITEPTVAYGTVYVIADGDLYALSATDGSREWIKETVGHELLDPDEGMEYVTRDYNFQQVSVAIADKRIYTLIEGDQFEAVAALDAQNGEPYWTQMERGARYDGPIVLDNDTVYSRYDTPDSGFEPENGIREYVGLYEDVIPASTGEITITGGSYSINGDGWERRPGWIYPFQNLMIAGETGIVYFVDRVTASGQDSIIGFDIHDGSQKWEITPDTFEDIGISQQFVVSEDTLYLQTDGGLYALRADQSGDDGSDNGDDDDVSDDGSDGRSDSESDDDNSTDNGTDGESDDGSIDNGSDDGTDDGSDSGSDDDSSTDDDSTDDGNWDDSSTNDRSDEDSDDGSTNNGSDDELNGESDDDSSTNDRSDGDSDDGSTDNGSDDGLDGESDDSINRGSDDDSNGNSSDDSSDEEPIEFADSGNGSLNDSSDPDEGPDNSTGDSGDDLGNESDGSDDSAEGAEDTPGFTIGTGLLGGVLGLEWLRRKAIPQDKEQTDYKN